MKSPLAPSSDTYRLERILSWRFIQAVAKKLLASQNCEVAFHHFEDWPPHSRCGGVTFFGKGARCVRNNSSLPASKYLLGDTLLIWIHFSSVFASKIGPRVNPFLLEEEQEAKGVIDVALLSVIRRWHLREGVSICEIARRTGLSRNTIRKYLANGILEPGYAKRQSASKLDEYADVLSSWLIREWS